MKKMGDVREMIQFRARDNSRTPMQVTLSYCIHSSPRQNGYLTVGFLLVGFFS